MKRLSLIALCVFACALFVVAQDPPTPPTPDTPPAAQGPGGPGAAALAAAQNQDPRPYDRVITKDAKSKSGIFTVHQVKNNWFYEIPKGELGKEFLWVNQIARTTLGREG